MTTAGAILTIDLGAMRRNYETLQGKLHGGDAAAAGG